MTTHAPDWIQRAKALHIAGEEDEAIDLAMDALGYMLAARLFDQADAALGFLAACDTPADLQFAALMITHVDLEPHLNACLAQRPRLYEVCWKALDAAGEDAEALLKGIA